MLVTLAGACGDEPDPTDTPEKGGTISSLKVTDKDGRFHSDFQVNHTIKVTVGFTALDQAHEHSVHVGLVEKLADGMDRTMAHTCLLGAFNAQYAADAAHPDRVQLFENELIVPDDCLPEGSNGVTMNLWVAMDPAVSTPDETVQESPDDVNTQFFNTAGEDSEGKDRNKLCKLEDGTPGCVIDVQIGPSRGNNIAIDKIDAQSSVAALPANCMPDYANPPIHVRGEMRVLGTASHDGMTRSTDADNILATMHSNATLQMSYHMCPAGDPPVDPTQIHGLPCATGTDWVPLKLLGEMGSAPDTFGDSVVISELVNGEPHVFTHALFLPPGSDACKNVTGALGATQNWAGYGAYNIAACVSVPFDEHRNGGDADDDNCAMFPVRVVVVQPKEPGSANSYAFTKNWSQQWGNDIVNLNAQLGTENHLTLSGATAHAFGTADLGGWVQFNVIDIKADAAAYVAIVGSGYSASVDVLGQRYWGVNESIASIDRSWQQTFSKQACGRYNYGVAGLGFNAALCASGDVGLTSTFHVKAVSGAGNPPFDTSQKIGEVTATATPTANLQLTAQAWTDLGVAKGGIDGTVTLLGLSLPARATLNWGLTSLSPMALTIVGSAKLDLQITTLSGNIRGYADVAQPSWCSCGSWCPGYPCTSWSNVWNADLVSFRGFMLSQNLLDLSAQTTLQ